MLGNPAYHENAVPKMWSNHKASGVVFQEFPMTTAERGADRRSTESTGEVWRVGGLIVATLPVHVYFIPGCSVTCPCVKLGFGVTHMQTL